MCHMGLLLSFDIVIPCLAHECLIMGQCVTYIHDICMTLTFDLNINIIFSPCICVSARSSKLLFDTGIQNLVHGCITMREHVVFIHNLCMTLMFDLKVDISAGEGGILSKFNLQLTPYIKSNKSFGRRMLTFA